MPTQYESPAYSEDNEPAEPEDDSDDTFLIPKSALYGKNIKPGDKETIEVVSVMDDEVEAKCVGKKEDDSSSPDMDKANSDLDAMATPAEA